jgi:hypothetical protein
MRATEFITERKKKRKKKTKLGRYFFPGFAYYGGYGGESDAGGGDGGGGESMYESKEIASEVEKFKDWAVSKLKIKNPPKIELSYDTEEAQQGHHTGRHVEGSDSVWVYAANRNLVDILRTVFHELVHWRQTELGMIEHGDSYPGSAIEAMADMLAGKYIKIYGKANRQVFQ